MTGVDGLDSYGKVLDELLPNERVTRMTELDETLVSATTSFEVAGIELKAAVARSPALMALIAGDLDRWHEAVGKALDLFGDKRNLDELWVWYRLCWAFGRRDTWRANETVEKMFAVLAELLDLQFRLGKCGRFSFQRRALARAVNEKLYALASIVKDAFRNDLQWNDRKDFFAYKAR